MTSSHAAPPEHLDRPLELSPSDWLARDVYFLMTGLVIPRPIGWISSVSRAGLVNLAPYSFFNAVSHDPPQVIFSSGEVKDSLRNVRETGQFVVNFVPQALAEAMNFTSTDFPAEEDEFGWAGLDRTPSARVAPPRVAGAVAHLECEMTQEVRAGNSDVVFGEVVHIHVDSRVWRDGRVDPALLDPVCRLSGSGYARLGEIYRINRPFWKDVEGSRSDERMPRISRHDARR